MFIRPRKRKGKESPIFSFWEQNIINTRVNYGMKGRERALQRPCYTFFLFSYPPFVFPPPPLPFVSSVGFIDLSSSYVTSVTLSVVLFLYTQTLHLYAGVLQSFFFYQLNERNKR